MPDRFLKKGKKAIEDMNPGDVGWIFPRCLQVDRDGVMFITEGAVVFDKPRIRPNFLFLNHNSHNFVQPETCVKVERLPDKTYAVDLSHANHKWEKGHATYSNWSGAILVGLLEQTCSNP